MSKSMLVAPSIPFAPAATRGQGFVATTIKVLAAPGRWLHDRQAREELAQLSEREWHDMGAGARDFGPGYPAFDDAEELAARRIALRAWRAPHAHAA